MDPIHLDFILKRFKLTIEMVVLLVVVFIAGAGIGYFAKVRNNSDVVRERIQEAQYVKEASFIVDYCYRDNTPVRYDTAYTLLKAIDQYLPGYFPEGPYKRIDFIALALTESPGLDQYSVGAAGEKGIFQIMQNMVNAMGVKKNYFEIKTNTELAMFVLRDKFAENKDYRTSIIAYNGLIKKNGAIVDKYWRRFSKIRKDIEMLLTE